MTLIEPGFLQSVTLPVSTAEAFAWHERPGAFLRLSPPWENIALLQHTGGLQDGARVVLEIRQFGLGLRWALTHQQYQRGVQFEDVQIHGPFARWHHTHRFLPGETAGSSVLEDRIDYRLPLGWLGDIVAGGMVRQKLHRLFRYRHRVTRHDLELFTQYTQGGSPMKILVTGATGLVGQALTPFLTTQGHDVWTLTRRSKPMKNAIQWDPTREQLDAKSLEGFDAVIHLAGENIAAGRWNADVKRRIQESRVNGTRLLATTLAQLESPPKVLVCASAVGFYGNRGSEVLTETSQPGEGFLPEVCVAWEQAAQPARDKGIRVVNMRLGMVVTPQGGALAKMLPPFQFGAGGILGSGRQYMSWIAIDDLVAALYHAVQTESLAGPVNAVSPDETTNAQFTKALGHVLHRPTIAPVPAFAVRLLFGEMGDALLLSSARVQPKSLLDSGFKFRYANIESALGHVLGR